MTFSFRCSNADYRETARSFLDELSNQCAAYWFDNNHWRGPQNVAAFRSLASFLNYLKQKLHIPFLNIGTGAVFIPEVRIDIGVLQELLVNRITLQDINLAIPVLQQFKTCNSFELTLKKFFCSDISSKSVSKGVLELLLLSATIQPTEAIAETFGSVVESAVKTRYTGNSPEKDILLQAELFVRFNGHTFWIQIHFLDVLHTTFQNVVMKEERSGFKQIQKAY